MKTPLASLVTMLCGTALAQGQGLPPQPFYPAAPLAGGYPPAVASPGQSIHVPPQIGYGGGPNFYVPAGKPVVSSPVLPAPVLPLQARPELRRVADEQAPPPTPKPEATTETAPPPLAQGGSYESPVYYGGYPWDGMAFSMPWDHRPCQYRVWGNVNYLLAWLRRDQVSAPLVTTGLASDRSPGALGQPGTAVLFGDDINYGMRSGARGDLGLFIDHDKHYSLVFTGLYLQEANQRYGLQSDAGGNPLIARPIFNVTDNRPGAFVDSSPGLAAGSVLVEARSQFFGGELNGQYHCCLSKICRLEGLIGFRYLHLEDDLIISDALRPLMANSLTFAGDFVNAPNSIRDQDSFRTANNFYGINFGGRLRWEWEKFSLMTFAKLAVGATDQKVDIAGSSTLVTPTGNTTVNGGILALPSNIGNHSRTSLSIVPEGGFNVGYCLTSNIQLQCGYSFLLWNQVVRAGEQIDPGVTPSSVPTDTTFGMPTGGPTRPVFEFNPTTVWLQTLNFGVEVRY